MTWEIEKLINVAQRNEPDPGTEPHNHLFVPEAVFAMGP